MDFLKREKILISVKKGVIVEDFYSVYLGQVKLCYDLGGFVQIGI